MIELRYTRQYKKDLKRFLNQPKKLKSLNQVLELLRTQKKIPQKFRPHLLTGEYKGCMECHIENDFLLIWFDEANNVITLFRLGSHSELFKK